MGRKQTDWREVAAQDKESVAKHEAAHATVAQHFAVGWEAKLIHCGKASAGLLAWRGEVWFDAYPHRTPFQSSCIGWAGTLFEGLENAGGALDAESLACDASEYRGVFPHEISATDERDISRHPQQWRACKTAAQILIKRRAEWEWIAARLLEGGEVDCHATAEAWTRNGSPRPRPAQ